MLVLLTSKLDLTPQTDGGGNPDRDNVRGCQEKHPVDLL